MDVIIQDKKKVFATCLHLVSEATSISPQVITGNSRRASTVRARFMLIGVLRNAFGIPYLQIGKLIGRDHTTVMHGWRTHLDDSSPTNNTPYAQHYREQYAQIEEAAKKILLTGVQDE